MVHTHKATSDGPELNPGFSLSPDHKSFVISLKTGKGFDLFLKDTSSGQTIRRVTTNGEADGALNHYPDLSPDGKWVAFSVRHGIGTKADIYILRIVGTGLKQVTATQGVDEDRPSWSPDGKEPAYGRNDDAEPSVRLGRLCDRCTKLTAASLTAEVRRTPLDAIMCPVHH